MKKLWLYSALKLLFHSQSLLWRKKFAYVAVALVLFVTVAGGLAAWATFRIVQNAWLTIEASHPVVSLEAGRATAQRMLNAPLTTEACLQKVGELISPIPWLTVSLSETMASVKSVCLNQEKVPDKKSS